MPSWLTADAVTAAWPGFAKLPAAEQAQLLDASMAGVEAYCRRSFERATVTEALDGRNSPRVFLSTRPVISIASVTVDGDALDNTSGTAWAFKPGTGELVRGGSTGDPRFGAWFPRGVANVAVVYDAGYDAVPAPVVRAGILTARWLSDLARTSGVVQEERIGDYMMRVGPIAGQVALGAAGLLAPHVQDDVA